MNDKPRLLPGDPAPRFTARSSDRPDHSMDLAAGHYIILSFVARGSTAAKAAVAEIDKRAQALDDMSARWFIVSGDPADQAAGALPLRSPVIRAYFDPEGAIRALYGPDSYGADIVSYLLSPRLQIIAIVSSSDASTHAGQLVGVLTGQVPIARFGQACGPPPILIIPGVFEPALCQMLIEGYEHHGGEPSGFMRDQNGVTVQRFDHSFKVRRDWEIVDAKLNDAIGARFTRRVVPEIQRAYNFNVTHMERHIVSCYDAGEGGHFAAHRDNTSIGTAHRRFACSLNLNADYEGGNLLFPEFGRQVYRPPPGGCVIFSCSLLHQATKVTRGKRYAFLPFLHDPEATKIREQNAKFIDFGEGPAGRSAGMA